MGIISETERAVSPINLPFIKPHWFEWMIPGRSFILFAMTLVTILCHSFCLDWEEITNKKYCVWLRYQTPQSLSKILHCSLLKLGNMVIDSLLCLMYWIICMLDSSIIVCLTVGVFRKECCHMSNPSRGKKQKHS